MSRTTFKSNMPRATEHTRRGTAGHPLSKEQLEQRDRFMERALSCLDSNKFEEFWARMDIVNRYTRQCVDDEPE